MVSLKINDINIPVPQQDINLELAVQSELSGASAFKTDQFDLPDSPELRRALGVMTDINTDVSTVPNAILYINGYELNGYIQVYSANIKKGIATIPVQFISGNGAWVQEIEGEALNTVNLSKLNHALTYNNVVNSEIGGLDYVYPYVLYGQPFEEGNTQLVERYPAVRVSRIVQQIFEDKGIRVQSNSLYELRNRFLLYTGAGDIERTVDATIDPFEATGDSYINFVVPPTITYINSTNTIILDSVGGGAGYDLATGIYTVPLLQAITQQLLVDLNIYNIVLGPGVYLSNVSGVKQIVFTFSLLKNTTVVASTQVIFKEGVSYMNTQVKFTTAWLATQAGDTFKIQLTAQGYVGNTGSSNSYFSLSIDKGKMFNRLSRWFSENEIVTFDKVLPSDITKAEFLKAMIDRYDLMLYYNEVMKIIYIESRKNFYSNVCQNWRWVTLDEEAEISNYVGSGKSTKRYSLEEPADKYQSSQRKNAIVTVTNTNVLCEKGIDNIKLKGSDTLITTAKEMGFNATRIPVILKQDRKEGILPEWSTESNLKIVKLLGIRMLSSNDSVKFNYINRTMYPAIARETINDIVAGYKEKFYLESYGKELNITSTLTFGQLTHILNSYPGNDFKTYWGLFNSWFALQSISLNLNTLVAKCKFITAAITQDTATVIGGGTTSNRIKVTDTDELQVSSTESIEFQDFTYKIKEEDIT